MQDLFFIEFVYSMGTIKKTDAEISLFFGWSEWFFSEGRILQWNEKFCFGKCEEKNITNFVYFVQISISLYKKYACKSFGCEWIACEIPCENLEFIVKTAVFHKKVMTDF